MPYKKRIIDSTIARKLKSKGALLVQGPKWCGKTTSAEQFAKSVIYIDNPSERENYLQIADLNITSLLQGDTPRLIDEWQLIPKIWDAVRFEVDHRKTFGQFILTGSAVPPDKSQLLHTGTGRFTWITIRTMSLMESGDSSCEVSLKSLFYDDDYKFSGRNKHSLTDIAYLLCRGGWPQSIDIEKSYAHEASIDYVDAVVNSDISRVDGVERNPQLAIKLLHAYARNQGTPASISTLTAYVNDNSQPVSDKTITSYINALKEIFMIEDLPAWNPNLRSKSAIRTTPTRYFCDPSIATAALRIGPKDLIYDLNTFGLLFETLSIRDLRVYAQALDGDVYHYRDSNGLECDAVVHLRDGRYGLIEIKLGGEKLINEGIKNLNKLESRISTEKMGAPKFKMILTAVGEYAYRRSDGILIVPIGTLFL